MKKKCLYFIAFLFLLIAGGCGTGQLDSNSTDKQDNQQTEETGDKPEQSSKETDAEQEGTAKEAAAEETDTLQLPSGNAGSFYRCRPGRCNTVFVWFL
ncbi:hypothetical protein ERJ70_06530 [Sediminibacillus dalangtanensis]|uniref:Uncharacterized protein n=1 Tax=Sediminibacillus dalangtanensis TaxID=2729421 RepID=A0ABX7VQ21_9BACI|nr:hypothetical protein [Sediminibacillus dalangtanensis]QTM98989.1 hypothetical protein ERJ70_06530 [Sediminibacillus dalangtanensis]